MRMLQRSYCLAFNLHPCVFLDRDAEVVRGSPSCVVKTLRELAVEHEGDSKLSAALRLGADMIDLQGEKIDLMGSEIDLLGMGNDELRAQIARVKSLLSGQREILHAVRSFRCDLGAQGAACEHLFHAPRERSLCTHISPGRDRVPRRV